MSRTSISLDTSTPGIQHSTLRELDTGALLQETTYVSPDAYRVVEQRNSLNTPGFRAIRGTYGGKKFLPPNPFYYYKTERLRPYGSFGATYKSTGKIARQTGVLDDVPFAGHYTSDSNVRPSTALLDQQALGALLQGLKGQKVNLGVAFAERKKTSALILDTASRIAGGISALRRGDIAGAGRAIGVTANRSNSRRSSGGPADFVSQQWLALQYGWKPLLSDVHGSLQTLYDASLESRKIKVSSKKDISWDDTRTDGSFEGIPVIRHEKGRYSRRYGVTFSYSHEGLKTLSSVGITNPLSVAWELLPWSFVIDWFVPVGQYIDSLDATLGLSFESGYTTSFYHVEVEHRANGSTSTEDTFADASSFGRFKEVKCVRDRLLSFPSLSLPTWQPYLTTNRLVSSLALIFQRFK